MSNIKTITTGILGAVSLNVAPAIAQTLPTGGAVQQGLGLVSQLVVLIATLVALFRRKKKPVTVEENE